jgi:hypothetical protein
MSKIFILAAMISLTLPGQAAELVIDKLRLEYNISMGDSACDRLLHFREGKDIHNLKVHPCGLNTGRTTFTLYGPPGTQVTLFAETSFGTDRGFLTVVKEDETPVWVLHIEDFPAGEWVLREKTAKSGAYRAFYRPGPAFREHVTSIRWGQWWTGERPSGP